MPRSRSHSLYDTSVYSLLHERFMAIALDAGIVQQLEGWTEQPPSPEQLSAILGDHAVTVDTGGSRRWLLEASTSVYLSLHDGDWTCLLAGPSQADIDELAGRITAALPGSEPTDDSLRVQFWAMGPMGPQTYRRRLETSEWPAVAGNYPTELAGDLERLAAMQAGPAEGTGRLMLWHGPPGTGKTHAIRALATTWRTWCDVDYIIDADQFFEHAAYMVSALVDGASDRWRLIVIEDAGRFLMTDAQNKIGEGLGRLLNLTDGLVGQGLQQLVLMTTNEPSDQLHSAVTRPGRCLGSLNFGAFPADEARAWLTASGIDPADPDGDVDSDGLTLAEMYARVHARAEASAAREAERAATVTALLEAAAAR